MRYLRRSGGGTVQDLQVGYHSVEARVGVQRVLLEIAVIRVHRGDGHIEYLGDLLPLGNAHTDKGQDAELR